jgi:glycosyltransferase involved in cell wall biosynthesis
MEALNLEAQTSLSRVRHADILIGIPSYNSAGTIRQVIAHAANGLSKNFGDQKCLILISDGGSTDGTLEIVKNVHTAKGLKLVSCRYRGVPGKGSAVRAIFEAAIAVGARSLAMIDSDLQSITPTWIKLLVEPTMNDVGLVTPRYDRHKYDGTITNQLCYPLTRALYGLRIRQPIGGDFGLSVRLAKRLIESPLWDTPYVPKFGIDIFITSSAIAEGLIVEEADLGAKIHAAKDPALQLSSMFREVAGSALVCMQMYEANWRKIRESLPVRLHRNHVERLEPPPVVATADSLIDEFRAGYSGAEYFKSMLSTIPRHELNGQTSRTPETFSIPIALWATIVYEIAAGFKRSDERSRSLLLEGLRAVWAGRVATFVKETSSMTNEEAERIVEEDAEYFERTKSELTRIY